MRDKQSEFEKAILDAAIARDPLRAALKEESEATKRRHVSAQRAADACIEHGFGETQNREQIKDNTAIHKMIASGSKQFDCTAAQEEYKPPTTPIEGGTSTSHTQWSVIPVGMEVHAWLRRDGKTFALIIRAPFRMDEAYKAALKAINNTREVLEWQERKDHSPFPSHLAALDTHLFLRPISPGESPAVVDL